MDKELKNQIDGKGNYTSDAFDIGIGHYTYVIIFSPYWFCKCADIQNAKGTRIDDK